MSDPARPAGVPVRGLRPLRRLLCSLFGHPDAQRRRLYRPEMGWLPVAAWCDRCGAVLEP